MSFISITGASVLNAPTHVAEAPVASLHAAVRRSIAERRVRFRGILLNPRSEEASWRSEFESPGVRRKAARLLQRDSAAVKQSLLSAWADTPRGGLSLAYSDIGLSLSLWLLPNGARVEPYHFGKLPEDRRRRESPLCGFSQLWIASDTPDYDVLKDHFEKLWKRSHRFWPETPARKPSRRRRR